MTRFDFKAGLLMGITNFIAYYLQTDGLRFTTPAKNAFITTMYVALSPLLLWIFWHERPRRKTYFVIPLALIGMGILTNVTASGLALNYGDLLTLISSIFWALQLIFFGKIASKASSPWIIIFMIGLIQGIAGWCVSFTTETQTFCPHPLDPSTNSGCPARNSCYFCRSRAANHCPKVYRRYICWFASDA